MNFNDWLILYESIQQNFDSWLEDLKKFELQIKDLVIPDDKKNLIISEIKKYSTKPAQAGIRQVKEDVNWFRFSIGFFVVKPNFRSEDLERAIDITLKMISRNEITRQMIGTMGWFQLGKKSLDNINLETQKEQQITKTQQRKMAKQGTTLTDDEKYIKIIAQEGNLKLYFMPPIAENADKSIINARHRILCSYGKGTDWCTASPTGNYHLEYKETPIYILHYKEIPRYQFGGDQFKDAKDNVVTIMLPYEFDFLENHVPSEVKDISKEILFDEKTEPDDVLTFFEADIVNTREIIEKHTHNNTIDQLICFANKQKNQFINIIIENINPDRNNMEFLQKWLEKNNLSNITNGITDIKEREEKLIVLASKFLHLLDSDYREIRDIVENITLPCNRAELVNLGIVDFSDYYETVGLGEKPLLKDWDLDTFIKCLDLTTDNTEKVISELHDGWHMEVFSFSDKDSYQSVFNTILRSLKERYYYDCGPDSLINLIEMAPDFESKIKTIQTLFYDKGDFHLKNSEQGFEFIYEIYKYILDKDMSHIGSGYLSNIVIAGLESNSRKMLKFIDEDWDSFSKDIYKITSSELEDIITSGSDHHNEDVAEIIWKNIEETDEKPEFEEIWKKYGIDI